MEQLGRLDSLNIREKKTYPGIPEGWKLKPLCCLSDASEGEVYYAVSEREEPRGMASFRESHTGTLYLFNRKGDELFYFKRHGGLLADKMEIFEASENLIGSVQRHKASKTSLKVLGVEGKTLYEIEGPGAGSASEVFHIRREGGLLGRISKRPTRIAEEGVSRNDHFGILFPLSADKTEKGILLGALFLVDLLF